MAKAKTKKKTGGGGAAAFGNAAKKTGKKASKTGAPVVQIEDENVAQLIGQWQDSKKREKQAVADRGVVEAALIPVCKEARRDYIRSVGSNVTSIKVNGQLTFTVKEKACYSKIPAFTQDPTDPEELVDNSEELRGVFGDEYDRLFFVRTSIKLTEAAAGDSAILDKLAEAFGADRIAEIFLVEQTIEPSPALIAERDLNLNTSKMHDRAIQDGLLKQQKPSFKD